MININELAKRSHELSISKGWWEGIERGNVDSILAKIALIHSELSEAWAEARASVEGRWYRLDGAKPNGFVVELADAAIRACDLIGWLGGCDGVEADRKIVAYGEVVEDLEDIRYSLDRATEFFRVGESDNARLMLVVVIRAIEELASNQRYEYELDPGIETAIELKHAYNMTRTRRHGGKLA